MASNFGSSWNYIDHLFSNHRKYQPLSFVYLVFNDTQIDGLDDPFQEQQFIGKVTFLKQF